MLPYRKHYEIPPMFTKQGIEALLCHSKGSHNDTSWDVVVSLAMKRSRRSAG